MWFRKIKSASVSLRSYQSGFALFRFDSYPCSYLFLFDKLWNERKCFFCIIFRSPVSYFRSEKRLVALRPLGTYFSGWKLDEHNEPLCKFNISSIPKVKEKLMTIFYILKSVMKLTLHFMFLSFKIIIIIINLYEIDLNYKA